jgi:environmental stress-induced protein Ves
MKLGDGLVSLPASRSTPRPSGRGARNTLCLAMMNYFCIDQVPRTAWKNGGGTTREIMCWPVGADFAGFDWRVSVATISASGPFSRFEGIDRVIMLLEGDGVRLRGTATDCQLDEPETPFAFSGDEPLNSELLGAESTDFNVMTRRSVATAHVEIVDSSRSVASRDGGLVMCLSGTWSVGLQPIEKGQGLWWANELGPFPLEKKTSGVARFVLVNWTRL